MKKSSERKPETPDMWSQSEESRAREWRKRGYGVTHLGGSLVNVYIPNKEDQHFTFISVPFCPDMGRFSARVRHYAQKAWENNSVPVSPYLMYAAMLPGRDRKTKDMILLCSFMMLMHCDELWIAWDAAGEPESHMAMELRIAKEMNIPVRFFRFAEGGVDNE